MVRCSDWSGGSGVFGSVGLFYLEQDRAVEYIDEGLAEPRRVLTRERAIDQDTRLYPSRRSIRWEDNIPGRSAFGRA